MFVERETRGEGNSKIFEMGPTYGFLPLNFELSRLEQPNIPVRQSLFDVMNRHELRFLRIHSYVRLLAVHSPSHHQRTLNPD